MLWGSASNSVLGQDEQLVPCGPHWAEAQMEMRENIEKPEVYKDRTRHPQEVVSSLSSRGVQAQTAQTLGGGGWRQNVSTYGETGLDELKALSRLLDLVVKMIGSVPMTPVKQPLWVGRADFNRRGPQSKLPLLPSPFHQAVVL